MYVAVPVPFGGAPETRHHLWKKTFSIIYTIKIENKKTFLTRIRSTLPITLDPHVRVE